MFLLHLELGRILDRDDPLGVRDERGEDVQRRRLAAAGAAGDHEVQPAVDTGAEELRHPLAQRPKGNQVLNAIGHFGELSDCDRGALDRQRRNDGVDPRSVRQAGIHHRRRLVDPPPQRRHDAVDHPQDVPVIQEHAVRQLDLAEPFDVYLPRAVHHDLVDGRILEEGLDGTVTGHLIQDVIRDPLAMAGAQAEALRFHRLADQGPHASVDLVPRQSRQTARIQLLHQTLVQPRLQLDKLHRGHPFGQRGLQTGPRFDERPVQGR